MVFTPGVYWRSAIFIEERWVPRTYLFEDKLVGDRRPRKVLEDHVVADASPGQPEDRGVEGVVEDCHLQGLGQLLGFSLARRTPGLENHVHGLFLLVKFVVGKKGCTRRNDR